MMNTNLRAYFVLLLVLFIEGAARSNEDVIKSGSAMIHRYWDHISEDDPRLSVYFATLASHLNAERPKGQELIFLIDAQIGDRKLDGILKAKRSILQQEKNGNLLTGYNVTLGLFLVEFCARNELSYGIDGNYVTIRTRNTNKSANNGQEATPE